MPSARLTKLKIKNAMPSSDRAQFDLWDASLTGLSVRVSAKGTKTFSMKCRDPRGVERRVTLGRYPEMCLADARRAAMKAKVRIAKGEILAPSTATHEARIVTLAAFTDEFLKRHVEKNQTAAETERLLRQEVLSSLGAQDFKTIAKSESLAVLEAIIDRDKPALAIQTLAAVRKMFNWAVSRNMLPRSPCEGIALAGTFSRSDFAFDPVSNLYVCPGGKELRKYHRTFVKPRDGLTKDGTMIYFARKQDCGACALKPKCCPNVHARKIARSVHEAARDKARAIAKTEAYVVSCRERKKVEMLFAHRKRILRLGRLRLRGPNGAKDEFLLAATAQNLRKLAKLIPFPAPIFAT